MMVAKILGQVFIAAGILIAFIFMFIAFLEVREDADKQDSVDQCRSIFNAERDLAFTASMVSLNRLIITAANQDDPERAQHLQEAIDHIEENDAKLNALLTVRKEWEQAGTPMNKGCPVGENAG